MLTRTKPKALDLFCCAGGAGMGLWQAGFEVVGVDIEPQPRYPFAFFKADALTYPLEGFDFIWASPPCQGYSALKTMKNARKHPLLIEAIRRRLKKSGKPYVIENVFGAPLQNATMLCGTMFNLRTERDAYELRRHRYFEANFIIPNPGSCDHSAAITLGIYGQKTRNIAQEKRHYAKPKSTRGPPIGVVLPQHLGEAVMGINWMNRQELSEAIPPAYAKFIGIAAMAHIKQTQDAGLCV